MKYLRKSKFPFNFYFKNGTDTVRGTLTVRTFLASTVSVPDCTSKKLGCKMEILKCSPVSHSLGNWDEIKIHLAEENHTPPTFEKSPFTQKGKK